VANPRTQTLMLGLIVAGLLTLTMGYDFYSSRRDLGLAQQELATQQAINTQMLAVNNEKDELEKKVRDIQVRIDAIQKLRASQQGPGNVLRSVKERVDNIPGLYLESVEQKGTDLTIKGSSPNEASVTRFGQSMEFSAGQFSNLTIETKREKVAMTTTTPAAPATDPAGQPLKMEVPEVVSFTIKCSYTQLPPSQAAAPTGAPAPNQVAQK
jgi:Tfp pilus assembly protein PilN